MLHHLRVRNLGVLEDATIAPGTGFTVITGETGAGKTMLLGALRLLDGQKASPNAVGPFGDEALAEGLFGDDEHEIGVTRVVPGQGKSRAYVDGNVVAASVLREKVGVLVEIVGQHDRLGLRSSRAILDVIDARLDNDGRGARTDYLETWSQYRAALADQRQLGGDTMTLERELDLLRYQADEIRAAGLKPGDDADMESLAARLRNTELINESISTAIQDLDRVSAGSGTLVSTLRRLAGIDPGLEMLSEMAEDVDARVTELRGSVRQTADEIADDPVALAELESRLNMLGDLKRKYGHTLEEVIEFGEDAARRGAELESLLERAASIGQVVTGLEADLVQKAARLTAARLRSGRQVEEDTRAHLTELGLPTAVLKLDLAKHVAGPSGADQVTMTFASDERLPPGPIHEIASGGELSRLMLALRLSSRDPGIGTMVFDEIDAGVGGATALTLGQKLAALAGDTQVLCVTHLPQVAAHASTHYVVERGDSRAQVRLVEGVDRLAELSRMLAGLPDSERGRDAAAELLAAANPG
jgi:DNA repair protein RecN (Recombination protein N)